MDLMLALIASTSSLHLSSWSACLLSKMTQHCWQVQAIVREENRFMLSKMNAAVFEQSGKPLDLRT
jgi:hypothetical protein